MQHIESLGDVITEQDQSTMTPTTVGGERYKGKDDYVKSIITIYTRVASLSSGNENRLQLFWDLDHCTKSLINSIISADDRDRFSKVYDILIAIECMKRIDDPLKYKDYDTLSMMMKRDDYVSAGIAAAWRLIGESRTYFDRYLGFETKLGVMRRAVKNEDRLDKE